MTSGISPTGRILGTRITVYDVLDYVEYHHTYIAAVLGISSHDVFAAQKFIEEHRDEVMRDYEEMLERDRRGNPPEVEKKLRESRAKLRKLLAEKKKKSAEGANGARHRRR
jgi:hypothetical protein